MKKKILACMLAVSMVFSAAACGEKTDKTQQTTNNKKNDTSALSKQGVFKVEELDLSQGRQEEEVNIKTAKIVGDTIYMLTYSYYNGGYCTEYIATDLNGNVSSRYTLSERTWEVVEDDEGTVDSGAVARTASNTAAVAETVDTATDEDYTENYTEVYAYEILEDGKLAYVETNEIYNKQTYESIAKNSLIICDIEGTEYTRIALDENIPEEVYFWPSALIVTQNNSIMITSYDVLLKVDLGNDQVSVVETNENTSDLGSPLFYKDGMPVFGVWDDTWTEQTYKKIDLEQGTVVEEVDIPFSLNYYSVYNGGNSSYDLLMSNGSCLFGYHFGDTELTLIMDYVNSDLPSSSVSQIVFTDADHFVAVYYDIVEYDRHTAMFTKVAPEDVPDRENIVIAVYGKDRNLTKRIIDFNLTNEQYRIVVKDYSQYSTNESYYAGFDQLDSDILSGNIPDIIEYYSELQLSKYTSKGVFADIYELIENDSEINLSDYCENVFRAYETNGKLYQLPIGFYISTVYGKTSIFGNNTSITWDELNAVLEQYPNSSAFGDMRTREDMLTTAITYSYSKLVDEENGTCAFNSDTFKDILAFAKQFPETIDWESLYEDEDYWDQYGSQYIEDRTLLYFATIYNMTNLWEDGIATFAEEVTPIGFPTEEGVGSYLTATESYVISAKSENKEGAWQFVKTMLSEEEQTIAEDDYYSWGLPVLKTALEKCIDRMKQKPYYVDYDGNKIEYDYSVWINGEEVIVEPATEEQAQKYYDFVLSVDKTSAFNYNEDMLAIITEEAAPYFNDEKTVDAVADVIQSRMSILISESR